MSIYASLNKAERILAGNSVEDDVKKVTAYFEDGFGNPMKIVCVIERGDVKRVSFSNFRGIAKSLSDMDLYLGVRGNGIVERGNKVNSLLKDLAIKSKGDSSKFVKLLNGLGAHRFYEKPTKGDF